MPRDDSPLTLSPLLIGAIAVSCAFSALAGCTVLLGDYSIAPSETGAEGGGTGGAIADGAAPGIDASERGADDGASGVDATVPVTDGAPGLDAAVQVAD